MSCDPWTVWIVRGKAEDGTTVYLADYCGQSESDVRWKVYMGMLRERFTGTVDERLAELEWEIVQCELHPVEPNPSVLLPPASGGKEQRVVGGPK